MVSPLGSPARRTVAERFIQLAFLSSRLPNIGQSNVRRPPVSFSHAVWMIRIASGSSSVYECSKSTLGSTSR